MTVSMIVTKHTVRSSILTGYDLPIPDHMRTSLFSRATTTTTTTTPTATATRRNGRWGGKTRARGCSGHDPGSERRGRSGGGRWTGSDMGDVDVSIE